MRVGLSLINYTGPPAGILSGVASYAQQRAWTFDQDDHTPEGLRRLLTLKPDGVMIGSSDAEVFALLTSARVPAVNIHFNPPPAAMGWVCNDDHAIGVLAAHHLLSRGHKRFGFFARTGWGVDDARLSGFSETVASSKLSVSVFDGVPPVPPAERRAYEQALCDWVSALPKPVGILCVNDHFARLLANACKRLGLEVPSQVAILGVDNDAITCSLSDPPLSSVEVGAQRQGYEAARLLDELMAGTATAALKVQVPPVRVIHRRSTDAVVASDKFVAGALCHMKAHLADDDSLDVVCQRLHCSRRTLERRFGLHLGVTPSQAWSRFRLEEAQRLLVDTDLKLAVVAELSGFREAKYLSEAFKKLTGQTPGQFRRNASLGKGFAHEDATLGDGP